MSLLTDIFLSIIWVVLFDSKRLKKVTLQNSIDVREFFKKFSHKMFNEDSLDGDSASHDKTPNECKI